MRVGVFRAAEDGRRTAALLGELGHEAVLAPVLHIVATGKTVRAEDADALIFTSAHAPEVLSRYPNGCAHLRDLPCWCVGQRTAAAARTAGFRQVRVGSGNAEALAVAITAEAPSRLVFAAGRSRKPELESGLQRAGARVQVVEVYEAEPLPAWSPDTVKDLVTITTALHYSRRSAALAASLARQAGIDADFRTWFHHCLSEDVAAGLRNQKIEKVAVAAQSNEPSLLELLHESAHTSTSDDGRRPS